MFKKQKIEINEEKKEEEFFEVETTDLEASVEPEKVAAKAIPEETNDVDDNKDFEEPKVKIKERKHIWKPKIKKKDPRALLAKLL